jgi:hypothetical protein
MPAGEIILVAYGEENIVLSENPQISFFKIVYRRYTNFSIDTVRLNFLYDANFGKKYTVEIGKIGDLLHKMWLVIELPDIPIIYDYNNEIDNKIKFKWTKQLAYAIIDYVEIEVGNQVVSRQWGEWMAVMQELNWNNFNSSIDEYIGNTPDLTTYQHLNKNFNSKTLYVPLWFWFCNNAGSALPLLCLEYMTVRFNIQLNNFQNCGIFSPSNYIYVQSYYGDGILGEPLFQISNQGIAWVEFDSIDIGDYDPVTLNVKNYKLYYRKISDNQIISSPNFASELSTILNEKNRTTPVKFVIYGLYSGSIFIPVNSDTTNSTSIYIQKQYNFIMPNNLVFKNFYLLCDYIYLDKEERKKFYSTKHQYVIEQITYTNPIYFINLNNKIFLEAINPCKYVIFMAQVQYFTNNNVNENFNYNQYFFDIRISDTLTKKFDMFFNSNNKPLIKNIYFSLNSNLTGQNDDMKFYGTLAPFLNYPMGKNDSGFGLNIFELYSTSSQPSGSINLSYFNSFEINSTVYPIDINYNKYIFKCYISTYNFFKIANGVAATIFNSAY